MEKINIAKLLKDCPKGMELDCTMFNDVVLNTIEFGKTIIVTRANGTNIHLDKYGNFFNDKDAKCVIFPKGKTTWEGFHRPFKDGDIIITHTADYTWASIFKQFSGNSCCTYADLCVNDNDLICAPRLCDIDEIKGQRLATKDERKMLFRAIEDRGYKWDAETRTLEKLLKFKVGDRIRHKCPEFRGERTITSYDKSGYWTSINDWIDYENQDDWELIPNESEKLIESEFKDGDVITCENHWGQFISIFKENVTERNGFIGHCVFDVDDNEFKVKDSASYYNKARFATKREKELLFVAIERNGYQWNSETNTLEKLIEPRFDITTLKPFESKVLVRNDEHQYWIPAFWGCKRADGYTTTFGWCKYCIPYEGNEHLLETTKDCEEYFKTWK